MLKKFLIFGIMISWVFTASAFAADNPSSATSLGPQDDIATKPVVTTTNDCLTGADVSFGYVVGYGGGGGASNCPAGYVETQLYAHSWMWGMTGHSYWHVQCCKQKVTYQPQQ